MACVSCKLAPSRDLCPESDETRRELVCANVVVYWYTTQHVKFTVLKAAWDIIETVKCKFGHKYGTTGVLRDIVTKYVTVGKQS